MKGGEKVMSNRAIIFALILLVGVISGWEQCVAVWGVTTPAGQGVGGRRHNTPVMSSEGEGAPLAGDLISLS
jgi:hypothetical protein